jgi:16S rRNA G966 N2-methylase RsmD
VRACSPVALDEVNRIDCSMCAPAATYHNSSADRRCQVRVGARSEHVKPELEENERMQKMGKCKRKLSFRRDMLHEVADGSVDLVYLDPPFNSQAQYNIL